MDLSNFPFCIFTHLFFNHKLWEFSETPGSRYSLVPGDYVSKGTTEVRFKPGQLTDLGVSKEIKTLKIDRKEGKCQDYLGTDSQSKCYLKILAEKFQRVSEIEGCQDVKVCWIPQVKNILKEDFINYCFQNDSCILNKCFQTFRSTLIISQKIASKVNDTPVTKLS